jgi:hypothetical protein
LDDYFLYLQKVEYKPELLLLNLISNLYVSLSINEEMVVVVVTVTGGPNCGFTGKFTFHIDNGN